jgi:hypothetical protein
MCISDLTLDFESTKKSSLYTFSGNAKVIKPRLGNPPSPPFWSLIYKEKVNVHART